MQPQSCVPQFFCAPSETGRAPSSFARYYIKSQGVAQGIYTALDIADVGKDETIPSRVDSYVDAQTKWRDICLLKHNHNRNTDTLSSPRKQGPHLDTSFVSTPSTPFSSPTKKNAKVIYTSTQRSQQSQPSCARSSKKTSSESSSTPYFLYEGGGFRQVFSSATQALQMCEQTKAAGDEFTLIPCWTHAEVERFLTSQRLAPGGVLGGVFGSSQNLRVDNDDDSDDGLS